MGKSKSASSGTFGDERRGRRAYPYYVLCVESGEYKVSLQPGKVYKVLRPLSNDRDHQLRLIDEEGEDYLYPAKWFVEIDFPAKRKRQVAAALAPRD